MADTDARRDGVSQQTDELASALLGRALDVLAVGEDLHVLLALGDEAGQVESLEFAEDGPEECLEGARKKAAESEHAVRYALAYRGAIADEQGAWWFFERYACPRFTTPDENGAVILDIGHYVK